MDKDTSNQFHGAVLLHNARVKQIPDPLERAVATVILRARKELTVRELMEFSLVHPVRSLLTMLSNLFLLAHAPLPIKTQSNLGSDQR